jgi:acyl-CoA synthetase (AMP-forming)/AMP-acid ligase II
VILSTIFSDNARRSPNDVAYEFAGIATTWGQANERANRLASSLHDAGVHFQDRAVILADNSDRFVETLVAIAKLGLVSVPMSPKSVMADLEYVVTEARPSVLFVSVAIARRLGDVERRFPGIKLIVGMGNEHGLPHDHEQLVAQGTVTEIEPAFSDETMRAVKFTSGTTGDPKGCVASHRTLTEHIYAYLAQTPHIAEHSVALTPLSLSTGLALNTFLGVALRNGKTIITDRFDPAQILDLIATERVERIVGVPTMIGALTEAQLAHPRDLSSLNVFFYSGAPASAALIRRGIEVLGCGFAAGYGSTESGGNVTYLSPEEHEMLVNRSAAMTDAWGRSVLSCGREASGAHIRLVDDELRDVPDGDVGEIMIKGPMNFSGYWQRKETTAKVLVDGWLVSGDLARRDPDGFYYVVDRKRDMIVSGGYNVYAIEVEATLAEHPAVGEAAVVGIYDPHWGEAVHAFVIPRSGTSVTPQELIDHCKTTLSGHKVPKVIHLVTDMPRASMGKVRKVELRRMYTPKTEDGSPLMA